MNVKKLIKNKKMKKKNQKKKNQKNQEKLREMLVRPRNYGKLHFLGLPSKITPVSQVSLKDGEKFSLMKKRLITPSRVFTLN